MEDKNDKKNPWIFSLSTAFLFLLLISACSQINSQQDITSTSPPIPTATIFSTPTEFKFSTAWWVTYAGLSWKPEGEPFVNENFIVYSDTADMATKERYGQECQLAFERIFELIGDNEELESINIFSPIMEVFIKDENVAIVPWRGFAHFSGILLTYNPDYYKQMIELFPDDFYDRYLIAHELGHVVIFRITKNYTMRQALIPHTWYNEGLPSYLGEIPNPIRNINQYETLKREVLHYPDNGNPIDWRAPSDEALYYPYELYELAVYYLIETYGMDSVIGVLVDMREGSSFEQGFENRIGMTVNQYQENFETLIGNFLAEE